ncbi:hypothetical protein RIF23_14740 [Lipingzhangella sp. LS1_29]|uniref:Cellulose biosynthesis protein BcsF n=1 Tax=Lipingzhangella rawalii TaxID=2055835 RepID=A0ABU2H9M4_9ACTN|nr:hypothetical protein [Lipingzhangella rawalii]MDS1271554.1 hypothetical protein [Lipingzhangella rawalii]
MESVFFALGVLFAFALLRLHSAVRRWQRRVTRMMLAPSKRREAT